MWTWSFILYCAKDKPSNMNHDFQFCLIPDFLLDLMLLELSSCLVVTAYTVLRWHYFKMPSSLLGPILQSLTLFYNLWSCCSCNNLFLIKMQSIYICLIPVFEQGHDDLCEDFFAYNRAKGTLYDGETRLFLRNNGKKLHT